MGSSGSTAKGTSLNASGSCGSKLSNCNSCSQKGAYFSFGKKKTSKVVKMYTMVDGKLRRVYLDTKGKYIRTGKRKKYLSKGKKIVYKSPKRRKRKSPERRKRKSPVRRKSPKRRKSPVRRKRTYYGSVGTFKDTINQGENLRYTLKKKCLLHIIQIIYQ